MGTQRGSGRRDDVIVRPLGIPRGVAPQGVTSEGPASDAGRSGGAAPDPAAVADTGRPPAAPPRRLSRLTVLSGPSGVGKGTVVTELRRTYPRVWFSVSVTTRAPRPGEADGRDYYFVTDREFDRMRDRGELLEWAEYAGHRHGTPRKPVEEKLAAGVPCLLEVDVAGARQVRHAMPDALLVFLAPPSWADLVSRLTGRGTEPPDVIARRLAIARDELAAESEYDVTLVNTSVQDVCRQLIALIENGQTPH